MALRRFTGGGSLDGGEADLEAFVLLAETPERDGGASFYALDTGRGDFVYVGYGEQGRKAAGRIMDALSARDRAEQEAIEAARRPRGCGRCGGLYLGSAFDVHRDGGRCLDGDAYGQLVQVEGGAWALRGSAAAGR